MENLVQQAQRFITDYGENGYVIAKKVLLSDSKIAEPIREVLGYLIEEAWPNRQHPALISMSCEAAGRFRHLPDEVSAALVLLTGAADMHDDIVDKSRTKAHVPTPVGKFSPDIVLLAGDILLLKSLTQLSIACEAFSVETRREVHGLVEAGFFELGTATARERAFKGKLSVDPSKYREIIQAKGAVSEACARIGAAIAQAEPRVANVLGHIGRTLGVLMTLRSEFGDLCTPAELRNRWRNEVLPLPLFLAFHDESAKHEILGLLEQRLTNKNVKKINAAVLKTKQVTDLKVEMQLIAQKEEAALEALNCNREPFKMLLRLSLTER